MTDIRARLADALRTAGDQWCEEDDPDDEIPFYGTLASALLSLPGIAIVELPEPDERLPADSVLIQWLDAGVSTVRGSQRVRCYLEDHRLAATEAHDIAAALLAAAVQAQEEQP